MGDSRTQVYGALLLAIVFISFGSILIKLIPAPALVIAAYRLCLATLFLAPFAWRGQLRRFSKHDLALSLLSGVFLALHFIFWISSLQYTSVASSVVLVSTNPIFVGLGTHFVLRERLGPLLLWGIAVSIIGGLLIGYNDLQFGRKEFLGDILALAGALWASAYFLVGRHVRQRVGLFNYIFTVYGMAAVLLLAFALAARQPFLGYPKQAYLFLFLLALGPQLLGHSSLNWALKYTSAATVAVATLGEPVGSTVLAYLILNEGLTPLKLLGGLLILGGIYLAARAEP